MSLERIREEYRELNLKPIVNCGIIAGLVNEDSYKDWRVNMVAPKDTPYKGGTFLLKVHFPDNYPNEPPEVCFITPIYHLNVNPKAPKNEEDEFENLGHISISTLNWWKPEYKMREVFHNIYLLFYHCNPDSPYGIDRAKEYKEEREVYNEKVKYFTKKYASPKAINKKTNYDETQDWDFHL